MKRFKKGFILLIVLICVSLAACGENAAVSDGEIAGGDWRTTGIVRDSGSIVAWRRGNGSAYLCA